MAVCKNPFAQAQALHKGLGLRSAQGGAQLSKRTPGTRQLHKARRAGNMTLCVRSARPCPSRPCAPRVGALVRPGACPCAPVHLLLVQTACAQGVFDLVRCSPCASLVRHPCAPKCSPLCAGEASAQGDAQATQFLQTAIYNPEVGLITPPCY